jgi:integrase/recombinase XerD
MSRAGKARATNKELDYVKAIIGFMVKNNYANPLPFKIEKVPYKRPIPRIPHTSEIEQFISEIGDPAKRAIALLMFKAGLRFKEATHVKLEEIEMDTDIIYLTTTKGGRPRICVLPPEVKEIMADKRTPFYSLSKKVLKELCTKKGLPKYLTKDILIKMLVEKGVSLPRPSKGYCFPNPNTGKPYTSLKTMFNGVSERIHITRLSLHLLRHTFGTKALEATGDLRLVRDMLGHEDVATTQFYTQVAANRLKEGMAKTQAYINSQKQATEKATHTP